MDSNRDRKRKKDRSQDEDDYQGEKRSRRPRTSGISPDTRATDSRRKRARSKSQSPNPVKHEKSRGDAQKADNKSDLPDRKPKETDMLNTRTGGAYIPPARLRMMQAQITDKSSVAYQRLAWEALKKSIHGHINKINVGNIGIIIKELLKENIVRGRGLLCRSVIQAQTASPTFTNVYAALVAAVNSRFPNIGELLLKRLVIQFKRGFKRNDKPTCISSASFIAHLVNQRVAHEILALELLTLLVETPTDDSVEVAIAFLKESGQKLTEVSSKGVNAIFEMLRNILHEGQLDKRVQYMIEVMFQVWKDGFKDHPALIEELELVPEEEQFTHLLMLDDATDPQDILNVFKFDEKYEENEQKYKTLSKEILGSDVESGEEGSGESGSEESDEDEDDAEPKEVTIIDNTETNLVALRRTIYLTINSSLDFEECAHKLMKMQLKPGQEIELCHMFLDCCAEQRTYEKFYGLLAQRFCNINRIYIGPFEEIFRDSYSTAHRLDTNRLRNVSKFFAHLLLTDSISWEVLECVKLNEEDTTSSSRIYIKILFQELAEYMGLKKLNDRLQDPTLQEAFTGIFPRDNPKNTRFSINFFTSIGLGGLTDELREHLKQMPKNVPPPITEIAVDSSSSSESGSSSDSSSDSSSSSDDSSSDSDDSKEDDGGKKKKDKKKNKTPKSPNEEPVNNKEVERWGHDGFYDTYGKDARRNESRPEQQRDTDIFVRPRDVSRRDDRSKRDEKNIDDRNRKEQRNSDDRSRREERSGDDRNRREERNSDDRSRREERSGDDRNRREERNNDDRSRREERTGDDRNRREERNNDDRSRREERNSDDRGRKDERSADSRNKTDERIDDNRSRRVERGGDDRNRRDERSGDNRSRRDERSNDDGSRRDERNGELRGKRDERNSADNTKREERNEEDKRRDKRSEITEDSEREAKRKREEREDTFRRREDRRERDKDQSKSKSRRNEDSRPGQDDENNDRDRRRDKEKDSDRDKQQDRIEEDPMSKRRGTDKEDIPTDKRRHKENKKEGNYTEKSDDSSDDDSKSRKHDKQRKTKNKQEMDNQNKYDAKRKKDKKRTEEEDSRSKKRDEKIRKESRSKENGDDGWDIRGSSVKREIPGRYWDSHDFRNEQSVDSESYTPERIDQ